jgi:Fur family transcriptional regulator, ferric uptake regulator
MPRREGTGERVRSRSSTLSASRTVGLLATQPFTLSAPEIEDALCDGERRVARARINRVLDELERLGLVTRVEVGQSMGRYEALRDGARHHAHLVCDACGELTPFRDTELERTLRRVAGRVALTVDEHELSLQGHCAPAAPERVELPLLPAARQTPRRFTGGSRRGRRSAPP